MMKKSFQLLLAILVIFSISSCKDKKYPTINILNPTEDSHYQVQQQFTVHVEMQDDRGIISHRYYFGDAAGIPDPDFINSGSINLKKKEKKQSINDSFPLPHATGEIYLHVEVTDDTGKTTKQSRRFYINP